MPSVIDELGIAQVQAGGAPQDYVDGLTKVFARLKDGSFPAKGQLLGAGQNYWKQWIKYSTDSPATLSRPQGAGTSGAAHGGRDAARTDARAQREGAVQRA